LTKDSEEAGAADQRQCDEEETAWEVRVRESSYAVTSPTKPQVSLSTVSLRTCLDGSAFVPSTKNAGISSESSWRCRSRAPVGMRSKPSCSGAIGAEVMHVRLSPHHERNYGGSDMVMEGRLVLSSRVDFASMRLSWFLPHATANGRTRCVVFP
jgi:hypothetical protein